MRRLLFLDLPVLGALADLGEAAVDAFLCEELFVRAALGDAPVVDDEDLIRLADGGETVRDGDDGLSARPYLIPSDEGSSAESIFLSAPQVLSLRVILFYAFQTAQVPFAARIFYEGTQNISGSVWLGRQICGFCSLAQPCLTTAVDKENIRNRRLRKFRRKSLDSNRKNRYNDTIDMDLRRKNSHGHRSGREET